QPVLFNSWQSGGRNVFQYRWDDPSGGLGDACDGLWDPATLAVTYPDGVSKNLSYSFDNEAITGN
ncbi:MAG: hypothetical protein AAF787_11185, partial [Chloroflexota bacterium]